MIGIWNQRSIDCFSRGNSYCNRKSRYKFRDNSLISSFSWISPYTVLAACYLFQKMYIWAHFKLLQFFLNYSFLLLCSEVKTKSPCPCFYIKRYYCPEPYIAFCYLENDGIDFERNIQFLLMKKLCEWTCSLHFLHSVLDFHFTMSVPQDRGTPSCWV